MALFTLIMTVVFITWSIAGLSSAPQQNLVIISSQGEILHSTLTKNGTHFANIALKLTTTENDTFILDLFLNKVLVSAGYREKVITTEGEYYLDSDLKKDNCYYLGSARGHKDSTASVSTCDYIVGFFKVNDKTYSISQPSGPENDALVELEPVEARNWTDGVSDDITEGISSLFSSQRDGPAPIIRLDRLVRTIELYAVSDFTHYNFYNNTDDARRRVKDVVNRVNTLYNALDMYVILVGLEIWTTPQIDVNSNNTLYNWRVYKTTVINNNASNSDHAVLFLGNVHLQQGAGGIDYSAEMCSSTRSVSVIKDEYIIGVSANIMAHEIGHSLGMSHDNPNCTCDDPVHHCIMYYAYSPYSFATKFSSCSVDKLIEYRTYGLDLCLFNMPEILEASICGNGLLEDGEECDCGGFPNMNCNSGCCNRTNCKLIGPAKCASGECCNIGTCKIKVIGTVCRYSQGICDLPETCDGVSYLCPTDTYGHDGVECSVKNISAYCYKGQCQSHDSQCEKVWGVGTPSSNDSYYMKLNTNKNYSGCKMFSDRDVPTFEACEIGDAMCGQLICNSKTNQSILRAVKKYFSPPSSIAYLNFGTITLPGFVPDGAKCGVNKACLNQKCVDVNQMLADRTCPGDCGNGVCNNLGECQCPNGLNYPKCTLPPDTTLKVIPFTPPNMLLFTTLTSPESK